MEYKELGIGNKINMLRVKNALGVRTEPKQYVSQLLDIDQEHNIAKISMPIEKKIIVPLEIGDIYRIVIYTSNGLYQCMTKIMKRYKENNLYMLDVKFISPLEKYQRREYYRLMCDMVVEHRIQSEKEIELLDKMVEDNFETPEEKQECINALDNLEYDWKTGTCVDLSGGGIKFCSPVMYETDSIIILRISGIPTINDEGATVKLRVIQSFRKENLTDRTYVVRGEFVDINNVMRENLVRYIFEEQRRRMKK